MDDLRSGAREIIPAPAARIRRYGSALLLAGHCFEGVQLPARKIIVLFKAPVQPT
jgi:hypothetical protein